MKKIVAMLLALTMMLASVVLISCGNDADDAPPAEGENEQPGGVEDPEDAPEEEQPKEEQPKEEQPKEEQPKEEQPKEEQPKEEQDQPEKERTEVELKIGTYNIANGSRVSHDLKKIADDILAQDLDIVGLQEVDKYASRSRFLDTMKKLSELTGYEYYYYTVAINIGGDKAKYGQEGEYGTGILSKYPIVSGEDFKLNSPGVEQRMLGHAEIDVHGKTVHFFNTHLSWETDSIRAKQFEQLEEIISEYECCILTGDFNQRSVAEADIFSTLYSTNSEDNPLETYKGTDWNTLCIDNILYTKEFYLLDSEVIDNNHSDHCLMVATLELSLK